MKNKTVILCVGIPASGKTTWTTEFISKNLGWVKFSRDEFRFMMQNSPMLDFKGEVLVTDLIFSAARQALLSGFNVILDNTHCKQIYIDQAVNMLGDLADIDFRVFDTPLETCIERDSLREKKAGESILKKMHKDFMTLMINFDSRQIPRRSRLVQDYSKMWKNDLKYAVICDIDGTLSHFNGKRSPFDWKEVGVDDPDMPIIHALQSWKTSGVKILIVSGRDGSCRKETQEWLKKHKVPFDDLFMRPINDYRKDSIVKQEIYENNIEGKYNVILVYDDRNQVVNLWRSLGIKCLQCEPGEF